MPPLDKGLCKLNHFYFLTVGVGNRAEHRPASALLKKAEVILLTIKASEQINLASFFVD